jgi:hypothetical protein
MSLSRNCPWQKLAWCWCASVALVYKYAVCDSWAVGCCSRPNGELREWVRQSVSQCGACVRLAAFICVQSQRVDWYHVQIKVLAAIFAAARTRGYELHTAILCFMLLLTVASVCFNARACFFHTNYIWSARAIVFFLPFQMIICDCAIVTWNPWSGKRVCWLVNMYIIVLPNP